MQLKMAVLGLDLCLLFVLGAFFCSGLQWGTMFCRVSLRFSAGICFAASPTIIKFAGGVRFRCSSSPCYLENDDGTMRT